MLVAEGLLLLLLKEEGATVMSGHAHDQGLAGALLLDLVAAERLEVRPDGGDLVAVGTGPLPAPLAAAWDAIASADRERSAKHWIGKLPGALKPFRETVAAELVARGVLDEEHHKRLGLFSATRFPERDPEPESDLRERLRSVLVDGAEPDPPLAALLSLLVPMDLVGQVVERGERRSAKARAKAVAERGVVGDAVKAAVQQQVTAAVVAATTAAAASGASAGAS